MVYQWVPRTDNVWADWLANVANHLRRDVSLQDLHKM